MKFETSLKESQKIKKSPQPQNVQTIGQKKGFRTPSLPKKKKSKRNFKRRIILKEPVTHSGFLRIFEFFRILILFWEDWGEEESWGKRKRDGEEEGSRRKARGKLTKIHFPFFSDRWSPWMRSGIHYSHTCSCFCCCGCCYLVSVVFISFFFVLIIIINFFCC